MRTDEQKIIQEARDNEDLTREKFSGYDSQSEFQEDLKKNLDGDICGALNNKKKMCGQRPMVDSKSGRCQHHGGKAPKGIQNSSHKHGRYSKYLPENVRERYEDAEGDEDLLSLRGEISLVTARIFEVAQELEDTAGRQSWEEAVNLWSKFQKYRMKGNEQKAEQYSKRLGNLFDQACKDAELWDEVTDLTDEKRKLVDSEQKKLNNLQQFIPVEKVMLFLGAAMDIVKEEVEKREGMVLDGDSIQSMISEISRKIDNLSAKNPKV